jgi:hypothetical protein
MLRCSTMQDGLFLRYVRAALGLNSTATRTLPPASWYPSLEPPAPAKRETTEKRSSAHFERTCALV